MSWHTGRTWDDTRLEDACPCPKAPCGLVDRDNVSEECTQHPVHRMKTMRQGHRAEDCKEVSNDG